MKKVLVITGPTASGKTAVSIQLAKKVGGEIVNADSMQIYRGCDIGSAKPSFTERQNISHHLIDIINPTNKFSTAEYKISAVKCIKDILGRGKMPVITGGTGLYIDALVKNIDFSVDRGNENIRRDLKNLLENKGKEYLYEKLKMRDSEAALTVHPNNTRRVIRYLEILDGFNGTLSEYKENTLEEPSEFDYRIFVLWPERDFVYNHIEKRVDEMLDAGLVTEVRNLLNTGVKADDQCMMGIGYKETYAYIGGQIDYKEYVELLKRNTRRYAKRQFTWFKRYKDTQFIPMDITSDINSIADYILNKALL
ncbi:MAG: tRNA (adenosine(37)-N6)-dimethylallyltransferase MiaA [Clostridiales bacterium]|nr:tRNA (adenosine(37)-N6)-dimethylallyltransferase MiaA [Clostridiales bacterium]